MDKDHGVPAVATGRHFADLLQILPGEGRGPFVSLDRVAAQLWIRGNTEFLAEAALDLRAGGIGERAVAFVPVEGELLRILATGNRIAVEHVHFPTEPLVSRVLTDKGGDIDV